MTQGPSDGHANIFLGVAFFSTYESYSLTAIKIA
jgi:hypothetical protein